MGWRDWLGLSKPTPEAWIDTQLAAARERATTRQVRAMFDAGETPDYTAGWRTEEPNLNDALAAKLGILRGRSRGLARNNDWAKRYLIQMRNNILGPAGITLQMRLHQARAADAAVGINDAIEWAWYQWGRKGSCDVSGQLSWQDAERLALYSLIRDGEALIRHRQIGPYGYQVQILNPAVLDHSLRRDFGANRVRMGVEITDDGQPVAYWIIGTKSGEDPRGAVAVGRHIRIPAAEILHLFESDDPEQIRGYPRLASGAQGLWMLQDYERSAAVASANAAKRVGFFVTPTGEAPAGIADTIVQTVMDQARREGRTLSADELRTLTDQARQYATTVPGQFDTLPEGTDFRPFESPYPSVVYADYIKAGIRKFAAGLGVSYATLGNDLEAVNYSSARVGIEDERAGYRVDQAWLIEHLHSQIFASWLPRALLAAPSLRRVPFSRLDDYLLAATWQPRRWPGIDPNKDANAAETNLALGLTSRRRLITERGDDPDEVLAEVEAERAKYGPVTKGDSAPPQAEPDDAG